MSKFKSSDSCSRLKAKFVMMLVVQQQAILAVCHLDVKKTQNNSSSQVLYFKFVQVWQTLPQQLA